MESPCRTPAAVSRPSGAQIRQEPSSGCRLVASRTIKCWECQRASCGPATVYVGLITSKGHRDQLQGTPLSLSPHERATKDQQSREKLLNVDIVGAAIRGEKWLLFRGLRKLWRQSPWLAGGVAALLSGSVPEFAVGLLLIGNAFLPLGALVWTSRVISISLGNSIGAAVTGEVGMPRR